jgi:hypothetical protein
MSDWLAQQLPFDPRIPRTLVVGVRQKSIVHHAKKGVFNYEAIVSDFAAMLDRISAKITREAAEKALGQRCKAFEVENGLFRHNITLDPHNLMVTIRCRDESEMKRFSLALKQASEASADLITTG